MRPLAYLVFAAITAFAAAGCPTGQLTTGGEDSGAVLLTGNEELDISKLPEGFPRDIPLYTRSRFLDAAEQGNGYFLELETVDSRADVVSFYYRMLYQLNWEIGGPATDKPPLEPGVVLACKDSQLLTMVCTNDYDGRTHIQLLISRPETDNFGG